MHEVVYVNTADELMVSFTELIPLLTPLLVRVDAGTCLCVARQPANN
jgi:hypothetical protein